MSYNPQIKNLPLLIKDLQKLLSGKIEGHIVYAKISDVNYEFDSSDGFEDVLDVIIPFVREFENSGKDKEKLKVLIRMLSEERPLQEMESYLEK